MDSVEVMMSTYNGDKYIMTQIDTIMNQEGVDIHLTIRDDGSQDSTVSTICTAMDKYPNRISLIQGENIGYRRSFLTLLSLSHSAQYYCYSDQDDYWQPTKVITGIKKIREKGGNIPVLYASSVVFTDENLNEIGRSNLSNMPITIESYFTRSRIPGCSFVFNEQLMNIVKRFSFLNISSRSMPDHDTLIGGCALLCGELIVDNTPLILHRRHELSVTNGATGIKKRIRSEMDLVFKRGDVRYGLAKLYLEYIDKREMKPAERKFLVEISNYKSSLRNQLRLLGNRKMTSKMMICDLETKFKILIRNF